ncbi:MAG: D-alanyl-D-alanine carboxypeptidase family protein, partial [Cellulomonadaceae bacterium]
KTAENLGLDERAQLIGIMTSMQESKLGLQDHPTGSGNDAGIFQQRTLSGWYGSMEQVMDPAYAARAFFEGVSATSPGGYGSVGGGEGHGHIPGLMDIEGWESMPLTQAAQRVQRSAYPDAYAEWEALSRQIMASLAGVPVAEASTDLVHHSIGCSPDDLLPSVAPDGLPTQAQLTTPSAQIACPDGTADLGANVGGYQGKKIPLRLCSIPGTVCTGSDCGQGQLQGKARGEVVVNSLVAPHFIQWLSDTRADGYDPSFSSSFRSWESQQRISRGGTNGNAARPGYSNHQMGAAVDISGLPGSYNRNNCAGTTPDGSCKASSAAWQSYWTHGIENGAAFHDQEFWHLEWVITRADQRNIPFISAA